MVNASQLYFTIKRMGLISLVNNAFFAYNKGRGARC